jgi:hypothetical protein
VYRWRIKTAALVALVGAAVSGLSLIPQEGDDGGLILTAARLQEPGYQQAGFTIEAKSVKGLYPGATKRMAVSLKNPYAFDLKVTSLHGAVISTSRRQCRLGSGTLVAKPFDGRLPLVIPARRTVNAGTVPLHMPRTAPETCQSTTFTVQLVGVATKASR